MEQYTLKILRDLLKTHLPNSPLNKGKSTKRQLYAALIDADIIEKDDLPKSFTGIADADTSILLEVPDAMLPKVCSTSKYINRLCNNPTFWKSKLMKALSRDFVLAPTGPEGAFRQGALRANQYKVAYSALVYHDGTLDPLLSIINVVKYELPEVLMHLMTMPTLKISKLYETTLFRENLFTYASFDTIISFSELGLTFSNDDLIYLARRGDYDLYKYVSTNTSKRNYASLELVRAAISGANPTLVLEIVKNHSYSLPTRLLADAMASSDEILEITLKYIADDEVPEFFESHSDDIYNLPLSKLKIWYQYDNKLLTGYKMLVANAENFKYLSKHVESYTDILVNAYLYSMTPNDNTIRNVNLIFGSIDLGTVIQDVYYRIFERRVQPHAVTIRPLILNNMLEQYEDIFSLYDYVEILNTIFYSRHNGDYTYGFDIKRLIKKLVNKLKHRDRISRTDYLVKVIGLLDNSTISLLFYMLECLYDKSYSDIEDNLVVAVLHIKPNFEYEVDRIISILEYGKFDPDSLARIMWHLLKDYNEYIYNKPLHALYYSKLVKLGARLPTPDTFYNDIISYLT